MKSSNKDVKTKIIIVITLLLLALSIYVLIFTPLGMTPKTFKLIFSIFLVEPTELSANLLRDVYEHDETTTFYVFRTSDKKVHPGIVISLGIHPLGA